MKKFNFRLQRVMEVRETKEKECQRELALSQEELNRQENLLEKTVAESKRSREGLRQALEKSSNAGRLTALDGWRERQEKEHRAQSDRTRKQKGEVDRSRKALVQASKEKKILERLRERRRQEHRALTQKEEQAFLDELGCRIGGSWKHLRPEADTEEKKTKQFCR